MECPPEGSYIAHRWRSKGSTIHSTYPMSTYSHLGVYLDVPYLCDEWAVGCDMKLSPPRASSCSARHGLPSCTHSEKWSVLSVLGNFSDIRGGSAVREQNPMMHDGFCLLGQFARANSEV